MPGSLPRQVALVAGLAALAGSLGPACRRNESRPQLLTANLGGATSVAVLKPSRSVMRTSASRGEQSHDQALGGAQDGGTSGGSLPFDSLVKIDAAGDVTPVFNQAQPVFAMATTPQHVIVSGRFADILGADGGSLTCYLVAIPRDADGGGPVECLSQYGVGDYPRNDPQFDGGLGTDMSGFTTLGTTVLFTDTRESGPLPGEPVSEFRRWTAGSDSTELLIQLAISGAKGKFLQPYAAADAGNTCVLVSDDPAVGINLAHWICGAATGSTWVDLQAPERSFGLPVLSAPLLLKTRIWTESHLIHLDDLSVGYWEHSGGANPVNNSASVFLLDGARAVGIAIRGHALILYGLPYTGPTPGFEGQSLALDSRLGWERIVGAGQYAWVYGASRLQRVDRADGGLDPNDYLASVGLLQVTDMSLSPTGRVVLDGTGSDGAPTVISVDSQTGAVEISPQTIPRLQSVVPLK
jgi:hypothetical protein